MIPEALALLGIAITCAVLAAQPALRALPHVRVGAIPRRGQRRPRALYRQRVEPRR